MKRLIALLAILGMMFTSLNICAMNNATTAEEAEDNRLVVLLTNHKQDIEAVADAQLDLIVFLNINQILPRLYSGSTLTDEEQEEISSYLVQIDTKTKEAIKSLSEEEIEFLKTFQSDNETFSDNDTEQTTELFINTAVTTWGLMFLQVNGEIDQEDLLMFTTFMQMLLVSQQQQEQEK